MAGMSTYLQTAILKWMTEAVAMPAAPATIYCALFTGDPGQTGANECTGTGYARVAVTCNTTNFPVPSASGTAEQSQNGAAITFPAPTGDWGTCSYFGFFDAATAGNFLIGGALTSAIHPLSGNAAPSFAINALTLKEQ